MHGYLSQGDPRLHFGLGTAEKADSVEVRWPDGDVEKLEGREGGPVPQAWCTRRKPCEGASHDERRLLLASAVLLARARCCGAAPKQPVYVGARACAACHEGKAQGNQYSHWLHSKHTQAWASLATPEAQRDRPAQRPARSEPQKAPICLGCHATAADAEEWETDADFRIEDGVQCEVPRRRAAST